MPGPPSPPCWLQQERPLPPGPELATGRSPALSFCRGSAYATTISYFVQTIFLFLYIVLKKLHLETWAGAEGRPAFGGLSRTPARAQGVHLAGGQKAQLEPQWRGPVSGLASTSPQGLLPLCSTPQGPSPRGPRSPPPNVTRCRALLGTAPGRFLAGSLISGW